jgi:probable F420-dependent oxidoreductase
MKYLFQYPDLIGPVGSLLDAGPIQELAVACEASGWDAFSFTDHPAPGARWLSSGGHQSLDPFVALTAAAAVTSRILLVPYLVVLPYRNPFVTAKAAATVDLVSNGRFVLGVGTGYLKGEYHALGVNFDERNDLFDESIEAMRKYWKGEPFSHDGIHFSAREILALPAPPRRDIPIWIGGNAKITKRRVAERAEGWMPLSGDPILFNTTRTPAIDNLAASIAEVKDMAGGRANSLEFVVSMPRGIDDNPKENALVIIDALAHLESIGVTWVVSSPPWNPAPHAVNWIHEFGEYVIAPSRN